MFPEEHIEFVRSLKDITVTKLPSKVTFECEVSRLRLAVQWFKDEQPIRQSRKYDISSDGGVHRLTLNTVETMDEAEYTVRVKSIKSSANLCIQGNYFFHILINASMFAFLLNFLYFLREKNGRAVL